MGHTSESCSLIDWKMWKLEIIFFNFSSEDESKIKCKKTPRYVRVKRILSKEGTVWYLSFVGYFATEFEMFLKNFKQCGHQYTYYTQKWKTCGTPWANLSDQNICIICRTEVKQSICNWIFVGRC